MKYYIFLAITVILFAVSCGDAHPSNPMESASGSSPVDTQFLFRSPAGMPFHAVYIDTKPDSWNKRELLKTSENIELELKHIQSARTDWFGDTSASPLAFRHDLGGAWLPVYLYDGKYFLYFPCDWGTNEVFWVTDSCIAFKEMDGIYDYSFFSAKAYPGHGFEFGLNLKQEDSLLSSFIRIGRVRGVEGLYRMQFKHATGKSDYRYCTPVANAHLFDLIVNDCRSQKAEEFLFEPVDWEWDLGDGIKLEPKRKYAPQDCQAANFALFKQPKVQRQFFHLLDSIMRVQYPSTDPKDCPQPNLSAHWLNQFLKDMDWLEWEKVGNITRKYHFNEGCAGFEDSPACLDLISLQFFQDECAFRLVVERVFPVEGDCIGGSQTSYGFGIQGGVIVDFGRQVAG